MLTEENYIEVIESYQKKDWQPVFDLIQEIESSDKFYEIVESKKNEDGVISMPYFKTSETIDKFLKIVHNLPLMVVFDWSGWEEGTNMINDIDFDYDKIDIPTKCKIITAIVRKDRFCEGTIASAFEDGLILKILKSIQKQVQ
jgi:hypothetical protein